MIMLHCFLQQITAKQQLIEIPIALSAATGKSIRSQYLISKRSKRKLCLATITAKRRTTRTTRCHLLLLILVMLQIFAENGSIVAANSLSNMSSNSNNNNLNNSNNNNSKNKGSLNSSNNSNSNNNLNLNLRTAALLAAATTSTSSSSASSSSSSSASLAASLNGGSNIVPSMSLTAISGTSNSAGSSSGGSSSSSISSSSSSSTFLLTSPSSSSLSSSLLSPSSALSLNSRSSRQNNNNNNNHNNNNNNQNDQLPSQLSSRIIHTRNGALSGVIVQLDGRHLDPVEAYRGIPYASPPVGNLRFMPPVSAAMWSGVKKADRFSPVCPQSLPDVTNQTAALERMPKGRLEYLKRLLPYLQNQSEDCLYLNIYVPIQVASRDSSSSVSGSSGTFSSSGGSSSSSSSGSSSSSMSSSQAKLPVMVFVHGESYEWNSGNPYDGSVLASFGQMLVVTINYRLGLLGFLNANTDRYSKLPANYGLMDIIAALHWLKENIAAFGGDPQSITLAGHGTGAACVHFLISSMAVPEGLLFNRAILMSGSGLTPWSLVSNPAKYAAIIAHHVNCAPDLPHAHFMKCLREKPLEQLLSVPIKQPEFGFAFGPSIDGVVIDGGDYVPPPAGALNAQASTSVGGLGGEAGNAAHGGWGTPGQLENIVLMRKTAINKLSRYDLMAGVTRAEAFFSFNSGDVQYGIEADRRSKILKAYVRNTYTYHLNEIFATIVNEYTDWERPVQHPINIRDETLEALSDAQVVAPAAQTVDLHSADHRNSYLYVFDYQTRYGDYPQRQGCIHGEDLPYIFGAPLVGGFNHFTRNYTKTELSLSEIVMLYWSNFVRTGNPNEHGSRQERGRNKIIEWTAYESVHKKYLNFDTKPKLKNHYRAHRLSFWLNLIPDLHKPGGDNIPASHHQLSDDDEMDNNIASDASIKPLNPPYSPGVGNAALGNFSIFTNQVFSLLNLSSPSSSLQRNGTRYTNSKMYPDDMMDGDGHGGSQASVDNDGFAAYSTALSVTIAIGCSLLILNVLIFAGVYYQRDKTRLNEPRSQTKLKRQESAQMPNNICGDLETLTIHSKSDPATILSHHHALQHHQLPPPEFADLPHRAPPPPKHLKSLQDPGGGGGVGGGGGISGNGSASSATIMGLLPPPHALQVMGNQCGTLTKKSCMKQSSLQQQQQQQLGHQQQQHQQQQQQQMIVTHQHQMQNSHNQTMTTSLTGAGAPPPPPTVQVSTAQSMQQHQLQQQQHQQQQQQSQQHPLMDELRV